MPMWYARSSYVPVRKMYHSVGPDGRPRPVMDLEAHYENTHHWFTVISLHWLGLRSSMTSLCGRPRTFGVADGRP